MAAGLILIGMGPGGINGMTRAAINAAKNADYRRYEAYTALWSKDALEGLEAEIGEIQKVMRPEVEDPVELLELAKNSTVALLIVGDPLQATTHVDLQLQAVEAGVRCSVIHGISITGLVTGAVGLSNYRFGRQTTLTYPYGGWVATSPLEVIAINRYQGLHTLALLDLDPTGEGVGGQIPMQPADAANAITMMSDKLSSAIEEMRDESVMERMRIEACKEICQNISELMVVLCSDMGTPEQNITYCKLSDLSSAATGRLHSLVIPAKPGDVEEVALMRWGKK
jgi:diphthine synthase|tara:strand:+ start:492 stop:1340 length:849 start_codon:yes stop_codon:yes gene_type:complete